MPLTWLVRWDTFSFLRRQISRFLSSSHEDRRYGSLRDWRKLIPPLTYLCILCCLDYSIKFLIILKAKYQYPPSSTVKLLPFKTSTLWNFSCCLIVLNSTMMLKNLNFSIWLNLRLPVSLKTHVMFLESVKGNYNVFHDSLSTLLL